MAERENAHQALRAQVEEVSWYHTIDLGDGLVTDGRYDHRPFLERYRLPQRLDGKTVLDIGAASGFFSFECERRGADVTAADLPAWFDHDFGPNYVPDQDPESGQGYLHQPFELAAEILASTVKRKTINIYDISPQTVGLFDIVFCGSLLIHLTDPVKALWNIASVTRERAIIATVIDPALADYAVATLIGHDAGDSWWIPSRTTLELMVVSAGFAAVDWVDELTLDYADGSTGPYHGILHAYTDGCEWSVNARSAAQVRDEARARPPLPHVLAQQEATIARLRQENVAQQALIDGYERGRVMRAMQWLQRALR